MKYLVLFEEFDNPLCKPIEDPILLKTTSKDTKDDELTEEEEEAANDRFFRQHNIGHEDWAIRKSTKNAKYRAL
ncbi:hypothetical protein F0919_05010 [Taibaiella lutea]|uniref:Uncharacterized protein n=1 Tax=Taibaiella lutea TaxID=2608001 RepID=A0A5M6CVU6_9BACT|nr:hypothetical protein [Taibaiella lutea]KAA5537035.1 hypothetical protein F0919_05010 [Taibaiella lutea]